MFVKQLPSKDASLSYFWGCAGHGLAAAVDVVAVDEDWFIEQAKQANVRITHVIDTHVHADHFSGGRELTKRIGEICYLHEAAKDFVKFEHASLAYGLVLNLGNVKVKVLYTPRPANMDQIVVTNIAA